MARQLSPLCVLQHTTAVLRVARRYGVPPFCKIIIIFNTFLYSKFESGICVRCLGRLVSTCTRLALIVVQRARACVLRMETFSWEARRQLSRNSSR